MKLLVPDRPGYGESTPPPGDWGWTDWQADITELLDSMSIDRAGVIGFSGGGPFALAAGSADWATQVALVSSVIPPAETPLSKLSTIPFALRVLFRVSDWLATVRGPDSVVSQYTERSVTDTVAQQVTADFHEGLRQGATAVARENRTFASETIDSDVVSVPLRAWHGTDDRNTPLAAVQTFVEGANGELRTSETDHLGTLLVEKQAVLQWLKPE